MMFIEFIQNCAYVYHNIIYKLIYVCKYFRVQIKRLPQGFCPKKILYRTLEPFPYIIQSHK